MNDDGSDYAPIGPLHVEDYQLGADCHVMRCGIVVFTDDTGIPTPPIDWYLAKAAHKATCERCLNAPGTIGHVEERPAVTASGRLTIVRVWVPS